MNPDEVRAVLTNPAIEVQGFRIPSLLSSTAASATCATPPIGRALRLLDDTWTLMIVHNLLGGTKRYGELLEALGSVSPKTVSHRLKLLEEIGFVQRQAFAEIPPRVEYSLTAKGLALVDVMDAIRQFAEQYLAEEPPTAPCPPPATPPCP